MICSYCHFEHLVRYLKATMLVGFSKSYYTNKLNLTVGKYRTEFWLKGLKVRKSS